MGVERCAMSRPINRLTSAFVAKVNKPGQHPDGGGLYLSVSATGSKSWIFRFTLRRRAREMGLGSASNVSLACARDKAHDARRLLTDGVDPIDRRIAEQRATAASNIRRTTFKECAVAYISSHSASWRNAKHAAQWSSTLETYVFPALGNLPAAEVDTAAVMGVLDPIWSNKPETANRIRGRIEAILAWATVRGLRTGANPAQWKNHLNQVLPPRNRIKKVTHHPALPVAEMNAFVSELRGQEGQAARALEFLILTATRTNEVIGARWSEIDFLNRIWIIPAERMKGGCEHRVPLSNSAINILQKRRGVSEPYIFGGKNGALSNMALLALLRRMRHCNITVHGFRSTFRDWAAEQTDLAREVAEMALAHKVGSAVEAAYRRSDLLEKRRHLMEIWARFLEQRNAQQEVLHLIKHKNSGAR